MARGDSGRIVLEIEATEKEALYEALTRDGLTLKSWFLKKAGEYVRERDQLQLFSRVAEDPARLEAPVKAKSISYRPKKRKK